MYYIATGCSDDLFREFCLIGVVIEIFIILTWCLFFLAEKLFLR